MLINGFSRPEGEVSKLGRQSILSCLGVIVRSSMVILVVVMILLPRCDVSWRSATVPAVTALLARWWFTNCPARCGLAVAFIIVFCSPGVVVTVREQVAALRSLVAFPGCGAAGLDPGWPGQGLRWSGSSCEVKAGVVRPIPWRVGPYAHLVGLALDGAMSYRSLSLPGVVLYAQGCAGMAPVPRWPSSLSWRRERSIPVLVMAGVLDGVRSLLSPSQGSRWRRGRA